MSTVLELCIFISLVLLVMEVSLECQKNTTIEHKMVGDCVSLSCQAQYNQVRWEQHRGNVHLRTFNSSNITIFNVSFFEIGNYRCLSTKDSCTQKEVVLNVQGAPVVLRAEKYSDISETNLVFIVSDIVSFPPPDSNISIIGCGTENRRKIYVIDYEAAMVKANRISPYITGYRMNITFDPSAISVHTFTCIEVFISNKFGETMFTLNLTVEFDSSNVVESFSEFLRENTLLLSLSGIGLLLLITLIVLVTLCRRLKRVETMNVPESGDYMRTHSIRSHKTINHSNTLWMDPVPYQTSFDPDQTLQLRVQLYDQNAGISEHMLQNAAKSRTQNPGVYSFQQSEAYSDEEYDDFLE